MATDSIRTDYHSSTRLAATADGVWVDERKHTVCVRRALLAFGGPLLSVQTLFQQTAGAVGGWTVAVRQQRAGRISWRR